MNEPYLSPDALILVAIIPSPEDLQVARILGWYRIPFRTAPRILNVDFLAFYQPASFQNRRWQVEFLAPVLGHEFTTRAELLREEVDHPRADEEYFKIQLGTCETLEPSDQGRGLEAIYFFIYYRRVFPGGKNLTDLTVAPQNAEGYGKPLENGEQLIQVIRQNWMIWMRFRWILLSALLGIPDS